MKKALDQAIIALDHEEVPIGAIIVHESQIVGKGYNMTKTLNDPTAHAEMIAITAACDTLQTTHLTNCQIFVTVEPCAMCAGALINSKMGQLIYGASEPKFGACGSVIDIFEKKQFNHFVQVIDGIMAEDSATLMQLFFNNKRRHRN